MLVHRRIKELGKFVSKEIGREALRRVYVGLDEAVATNGNVLIRMPVGTWNDDQYPATGTEEITEPVLLDTETLDKAVSILPKKPTLPILNNIRLGISGGKLVIDVGLPVVQLSVQDGEGLTYPDYKRVIPDYANDHPLKFAVDAKILKLLCELAIRHGNALGSLVFEIPTTKLLFTHQIAVDEEGNPQFDDAGEPVMATESRPIQSLTSGLKFEIRNEDGVVFHGILMPLRINE